MIELLAPAGDQECVRAAIANGANAIYFGLDCGFNARYRAKNFGVDDLGPLADLLHKHNMRGYVTMNTLVFPSEMPKIVDAIIAIAESGIDAVLVQDFGVARLVREICPDLEIHASTQMSLTSSETISVASSLGLARVVLARELSLREIRKIAAATTMPLEVFIHGALCVAYSGQCLTSESLGGRSANRGQCAQACRLPYELVVDGADRPTGDTQYLLSPQDLAGYESIPALIDAGIASIKIEGRLKTPEYVANIVSTYRKAIDDTLAGREMRVGNEEQRRMELSFSRGFSPGWLEGNNHKRLVPGLSSAKRGLLLGQIEAIGGDRIVLKIKHPLALGDGIAVALGQNDDWIGGRVYSLRVDDREVNRVSSGQSVSIAGRHGDFQKQSLQVGQSVFKNDDPALNRELRKSFSRLPRESTSAVHLTFHAHIGERPKLEARTQTGLEVKVEGAQELEEARKRPIDFQTAREKLGRLGGSGYHLESLELISDGMTMVPVSMLNELRRMAIERLSSLDQSSKHPTADRRKAEILLSPWKLAPSRESMVPKLNVLCRTLDQVQAISQLEVGEICVDFHDVRLYEDAVRVAHQAGRKIRIASVRMQKPGEMGLLSRLARLGADGLLARNLAAIQFGLDRDMDVIADFSLNVTNHRSAEFLSDLGVSRFTASYDLNRDQLTDLVDSLPSWRLEVVIHQHMPMFHMEHCVFCAMISPGTNKTNCGRPCDEHEVKLRDRVGAVHPLHADVACRNTLYNQKAQSGAEAFDDLCHRGVQWFRVELLEQTPSEAKTTVQSYLKLLSGKLDAAEVWRQLGAINRLGLTRGTLEAGRQPLAIVD